MTITTITIDAAGTLIHPAEPVAISYGRLAAQFGSHLDPQALAAAFRHGFSKMPPMAFSTALDKDELDRAERGWWRRLVKQITEEAGGVRQFDEYFSVLYGYYATSEAWRLYPEVHSVVAALRAQDIKLAVVSNFDSRLLPVLDGLGIASSFGHIVYSTASGAAKPDGAIFADALRQTGSNAGTTLHVGDNASADYSGAKAAGMHALLLHRDGRDCEAPHEAPDLHGIHDYLSAYP
jgi:putative hydrolase of the HAD superfamily